MQNKREPLVWLDMEMTGLNPEQCLPIEVAVIVTDADLNELAHCEAVIHQSEESMSHMDDFVRNMHTENGLLNKVIASNRLLSEVDQEFADFLEIHVGNKGVLAGNSIHADRAFIKKYFPLVEAQLHYRMVDVSTFKELVKRWYGEDQLFTKTNQHTAMADIRESLVELNYYKKKFFKTP